MDLYFISILSNYLNCLIFNFNSLNGTFYYKRIVIVAGHNGKSRETVIRLNFHKSTKKMRKVRDICAAFIRNTSESGGISSLKMYQHYKNQKPLRCEVAFLIDCLCSRAGRSRQLGLCSHRT
jgi:hypothetical protein